MNEYYTDCVNIKKYNNSQIANLKNDNKLPNNRKLSEEK